MVRIVFMQDEWFYGSGATRMGPFPRAELERQIAIGQVPKSTQVWSQWTGWMSAEEVLAGKMRSWDVDGPMNAAPLAMNNDASMKFIAPTANTSGLALIAGYIGIAACFVFPIGPIALALGILALRDLNRNPQKNGKARAITGIVLGAIGCLIGAFWLFTVIFRPH